MTDQKLTKIGTIGFTTYNLSSIEDPTKNSRVKHMVLKNLIDTLCQAETEQMIGRFSRSKGMQNETAFTLHEMALPFGQLVKQLLEARKRVRNNDGSGVLKRLSMWYSLSSDQIQVFAAAFGQINSWWTSIVGIKKKKFSKDIQDLFGAQYK